jgi:hypothetical protein
LQFVSGWKKAVKDYEINPFWFKAELLLGVDGQRPIIDAICRHFEIDEVTDGELRKPSSPPTKNCLIKSGKSSAKYYQHRLTAERQTWVEQP